MTEVQILLDIQRTLGKVEAEQENSTKKLNSIHEEVKYTNGRVTKLRHDVDKILDDIVREEGARTQANAVSFSFSKEQIAILGGAVITIIAYIADKLSLL